MQGWADVSWRSGGQTLMPTLDALRRGGVELTNMQMYKFCTPTRSSFMWVLLLDSSPCLQPIVDSPHLTSPFADG
jgi:hypothetical protein